MKPQIVLLVLGIVAISALWAGSADEGQIARCESIDPEASRTGLIFNPPGKQSYYERSRCFLGLAVESRNVGLCARVIERESWFFDGSGISPEACREAVREQMASDQVEADGIQDLHYLVSASLGASSNGRDFTLQLVTTGSHPGVYRVDIELLPLQGQESRQVESYRQPLGTSPSRLSRHVPREKLVSGDAGRPSPAQLRVTMTLVASSSVSEWALQHVEQPLSSSRTLPIELSARTDDSASGGS